MTKLCDLCGREMVQRIMVCGVDCHPGDANCNNYCNHIPVRPLVPSPLPKMRCPADPKDCRITALERKLEEAKAIGRQLQQIASDIDKEKCELSRQLASASAALEKVKQQVVNLEYSNNSYREMAESWRAAACERDALQANLDTANGALLVIRERLGKSQWCLTRAMLKGMDFKEQFDANQEALTNTASTAEAAERGIRENEREKFIKLVCTPGHDLVVQIPESGAPYFRESHLRAILGEKDEQ